MLDEMKRRMAEGGGGVGERKEGKEWLGNIRKGTW